MSSDREHLTGRPIFVMPRHKSQQSASSRVIFRAGEFKFEPFFFFFFVSSNLKWIENYRGGGGGGGMGYPSVVVKSFDITPETIILCSFSLLTLSLSLSSSFVSFLATGKDSILSTGRRPQKNENYRITFEGKAFFSFFPTTTFVVRNRKMAAAGRITFFILFFLIFTSFTLPRRSGVEN